MTVKKYIPAFLALLFAVVCQAQPGIMPPPPPQVHPHSVPPGPHPGPQMMRPERTPLLIISGREASFEDMMKVNPQDIESMSIFHDSDFTQRYGEKGKDGVIIVRLKSDSPEPEDPSHGFVGNVGRLIVPEEVSHPRDFSVSKNLVPYDSLTEEPSFMGGNEVKFVEWLSDRIVRPESCTHSGRLQVSFVIGEDGKVSDVKIVHGVCEVLDALVLRAVSDSPDWTPGRIDGIPVNVMYTMPVVFRYR